MKAVHHASSPLAQEKRAARDIVKEDRTSKNTDTTTTMTRGPSPTTLVSHENLDALFRRYNYQVSPTTKCQDVAWSRRSCKIATMWKTGSARVKADSAASSLAHHHGGRVYVVKKAITGSAEEELHKSLQLASVRSDPTVRVFESEVALTAYALWKYFMAQENVA